MVVKDNIKGVYPRWHISFNITMLRLVSYNLDYYWACNAPSDEVRANPFDIPHTLNPTIGTNATNGETAQNDTASP
jgi:hypothetical protein